MAYVTELTQDCLGIWHTGSGIVTGDDLLRGATLARQLVQNTENFLYEVVDLTHATGLDVPPETLGQILEEDRAAAKWRPNAIVVVVAPRDDTFALAEEWENAVQPLGWTIHLSREITEAISWLGDFMQREIQLPPLALESVATA